MASGAFYFFVAGAVFMLGFIAGVIVEYAIVVRIARAALGDKG